MPNCVQFIDKSTKQAASPYEMDNELREFLGVEPDLKRYYLNWYDNFGMSASMGRSFADMRVSQEGNEEAIKIIDWLDSNYTIHAWYEPKL